jgi:hypothetical protein
MIESNLHRSVLENVEAPQGEQITEVRDCYFSKNAYCKGNRGGSVGIALGYSWISEELRFDSRHMQEFSSMSRCALESNKPPIQRLPRAISPGTEWQEREAYHWLSSNSEVEKGRDISPLPRTSLLPATWLINHRYIFTVFDISSERDILSIQYMKHSNYQSHNRFHKATELFS